MDVTIIASARGYGKKKRPRRGRWHDALNALEVSRHDHGVVTGQAISVHDVSQAQAVSNAAKRLRMKIVKERQDDGSYRIWRLA